MRNGRIWVAVLGLSTIVSFTGCGPSEMKSSAATGMMGDSMMGEEKMSSEKMMGGDKMMGGEKMMTQEKMKEEKMMSGEKK